MLPAVVAFDSHAKVQRYQPLYAVFGQRGWAGPPASAATSTVVTAPCRIDGRSGLRRPPLPWHIVIACACRPSSTHAARFRSPAVALCEVGLLSLYCNSLRRAVPLRFLPRSSLAPCSHPRCALGSPRGDPCLHSIQDVLGTRAVRSCCELRSDV